MTLSRCWLIISVTVFFITACKKSVPAPALSSTKVIDYFIFKTDSNSVLKNGDVYGIIKNDSIFAGVPEGTAITALSPSISYKGKSIMPGNNARQNFTNPVQYSVTAENGSTRVYKVIVYYLQSAKEIISFRFNAADNPGLGTDVVLTMNNDTLSGPVPPDMDLRSLVPSITFKGKTISPGNKNPQDFSLPVNYTVVAEDGSSKSYTVNISPNAVIYVGSYNGYLYALEASTGRVKWKYNAGGIVYGPAFSTGMVYAGNSLGLFFALDAVSGALQWKLQLSPGQYNEPAIDNGTIGISCFTPGWGGYLYAVNQQQGTIRWQKGIQNGFTGYFSATIVNGIVYGSSLGRGLEAFDAATGSLIWHQDIGIGRGNPVVVNNSVYSFGELTSLSAFDAATGNLQWKASQGGTSISCTSRDGLIIGSYNGIINALGMADGMVKWSVGGYDFLSSPSYTRGMLLAGGNGYTIFGIDATTGKRLWSKAFGFNDTINSLFTAANGVGYISISGGRLLAVNAATGTVLWEFQENGFIGSNACVVDSKGAAYYASESGNQQ